MRRLILVLISIFLVSGCATTHMLKPDQAPDLAPKPDSALLVIIRDSFFGGGIVFWNYLDDKFIGETMGNTYFITQVPPGEHYVVSSTENRGVARFDFVAGKRYFLRQSVTIGLWRARTTGFSPLASDEAQKAIKGCSYLELDRSKEFPDMDAALYQQAIEEYNTGVKEKPDSYKALLEYNGE